MGRRPRLSRRELLLAILVSDFPMQNTAHTVALNASFQAFANCYLREVNAGSWTPADSWRRATDSPLTGTETHVLELELESQSRALAIGVSYRSLVGRHTLTVVYARDAESRRWKRLDLLSAQLLLIDDVYSKAPESQQRLELIGRLLESHQVMTAYLEHWQSDRNDASLKIDSFIGSEQSVVFGHWLHPTPKSRQGIYSWQHNHYTPELGGRFQLHFFAVARALVEQHSLLDASAEELSRRIARSGSPSARQRRLLSALGEEYCLIPLHPLQAQWLLHQDYVVDLTSRDELIDVGRLGPQFTPTSSVRSLYCESLDFMVKVSMPVKITNSLRINLKSELGDSVWITQLLRECDVTHKFPELCPLEDPAYITLALPDREETGFEVIFRANPFGGTEASRHVQSIAALVQDPLPGQAGSQLARLVRAMAEREGSSTRNAGQRWFEAYFRCSIESTLALYDEFGVSLEAHQQNVLLEFDAAGYPIRCFYRDIQGLALAEGARTQLLALVPELEGQEKIFEENDIVRNGFGYYVFFNQLYSVINRLGLDGILEESEQLDLVRARLIELRRKLDRFGAAFIDSILRLPTVSCKANLLTRVADMDELQSENELAIYTMVDNPLYVPPSE